MGKKQKDKFKNLEKLEKEYFKKLDQDLKKLSKKNFADFKKGVVKHIRYVHEAYSVLGDEICSQIKWCAEQHDNMIGGVKDGLEERDKLIRKAFEERDDRIDMIAATIVLISGKALGNTTRKHREKISEVLGYKWTKANEKALLKAVESTNGF